MKVTLLQHTPEPEKAIGMAGRLCYYPGTGAELWANDDFDYVTMVRKLKKMGHETPFEQANFIFAIDGVSRVTSHQLVRHRMASFNQQSQRYVAYNHINSCEDFVYPLNCDDIDEYWAEDLFGMFEAAYFDACKYYKEIIEYLMNERGMDEKEAAENARYVLPGAMKTNLIVSMNARELFHFFKQRCCNRAQEEIRTVAWTMKHTLTEKFPAIFEDSGPDCLVKGCKEGSMSCGKPYQKGLF